VTLFVPITWLNLLSHIKQVEENLLKDKPDVTSPLIPTDSGVVIIVVARVSSRVVESRELYVIRQLFPK
jgi:hypothetical protein